MLHEDRFEYTALCLEIFRTGPREIVEGIEGGVNCRRAREGQAAWPRAGEGVNRPPPIWRAWLRSCRPTGRSVPVRSDMGEDGLAATKPDVWQS